MSRIKIDDLPPEQKVTREEMEKVLGGFNPQPEPPARSLWGGRSKLFEKTTWSW